MTLFVGINHCMEKSDNDLMKFDNDKAIWTFPKQTKQLAARKYFVEEHAKMKRQSIQ